MRYALEKWCGLIQGPGKVVWSDPGAWKSGVVILRGLEKWWLGLEKWVGLEKCTEKVPCGENVYSESVGVSSGKGLGPGKVL